MTRNRQTPLARRLAAAAFIALGVAALVSAQQAKRILLVDKESNVEIVGYSGFNIKYLGKGRSSVTATGKPLVVNWTTQEMNLKTSRFVGTVAQGEGRSLELESATLTGVDMLLKRASAAAGSTAKQELVMTGESGTYTASTSTLKLLGGIKIERKDPAAEQSMTLTGASATIILYPNPLPKGARSAMKSGEVAGPVRIEVNSVRVEEGKKLASKIVATGNRLDLSDPDSTMTLTGNVRITGNDPALMGDVTANKVTMKFDAKGNLEEIDAVGEPTNAKLGIPPKGAARR